MRYKCFEENIKSMNKLMNYIFFLNQEKIDCNLSEFTVNVTERARLLYA